MTDYRKTEEDVKNQFISPSIEKSGWAKTDMRMEYGFTDGRIIYVGDSYGRAKRKKADYILMANSIDLAIVEAKDENHSISAGLLQAVGYAETLNIPFAYSTNGHGYIEYDLLTLQQRELPRKRLHSSDVFLLSSERHLLPHHDSRTCLQVCRHL